MTSNSASRIRLILVDDHIVLRTSLANFLNCSPGMQVVGEGADGRAAIDLWKEHQPDLLLLDLCLPGMDGVETLIRLRSEIPEAKVLILTSSEAPEEVRHAISAGAAGYVTKNAHPQELLQAITDVCAGRPVIGRTVAAQLAADASDSMISRRELEVLGLVRQGFTNSEIGRLLGVSENTAKAHVKALLAKLHAADRAEAVSRGFERGLLKP